MQTYRSPERLGVYKLGRGEIDEGLDNWNELHPFHVLRWNKFQLFQFQLNSCFQTNRLFRYQRQKNKDYKGRHGANEDEWNNGSDMDGIMGPIWIMNWFATERIELCINGWHLTLKETFNKKKSWNIRTCLSRNLKFNCLDEDHWSLCLNEEWTNLDIGNFKKHSRYLCLECLD